MQKIKAGTVLFKEGDEAHAMYVVHTGTVSVRVKQGDKDIELAKVFPNEVLGELAFFNRKPRSASAIAVTDVQLTEVNFEALDQVYKTVPNYLQTIFACVAHRLRKATDTIRQLSAAKGGPQGEQASVLMDLSLSLDPESVMTAASAAGKK